MPDRGLATRVTHASRRAAVLLLGCSLAGCGSVGLPFGKDSPSAETTGSIAAVPYAAPAPAPTVDPSDWEAIRRTVAMALVTGENSAHDWVNPDTGSSGTITQTVELAGQKDARCRLFATTVNDFRGSRQFRGQICQQTDGRWVLVSVTPEDAALS